MPSTNAKNMPLRHRVWESIAAPVLTPLIRDRKWALLIALVAIVQVAAGYFGFRTFECPMKSSTGIDCPGCGLSRGAAAFIRGNWMDWLALHAMAPFFLLGASILIASVVLPSPVRSRFVRWVEAAERYTKLPQLVIVMTIVYWLVRLGYAGVNG